MLKLIENHTLLYNVNAIYEIIWPLYQHCFGVDTFCVSYVYSTDIMGIFGAYVVSSGLYLFGKCVGIAPRAFIGFIKTVSNEYFEFAIAPIVQTSFDLQFATACFANKSNFYICIRCLLFSNCALWSGRALHSFVRVFVIPDAWLDVVHLLPSRQVPILCCARLCVLVVRLYKIVLRLALRVLL